MQEIILNGNKAYITDIVERGDYLVYKRGFCSGEVFPLPAEVKIKEDKRKYLPTGLNIISLLYYGDIRIVDNMLVSNWYDKYRLVDGEEFKISYDAKKRFGGSFISHSHQTCLPFIQIECNEIMVGIYSVDEGKVIAKRPLFDVCFDWDEFCLHSQNIEKIIQNSMC